MRTAALGFVVVAALAAIALAAEDTKVERDGFRLAVPAGWVELPEIANGAANGVLGGSTEFTGGAIAHGDKQAGVFLMAVWVTAKQKVKVVRPELEAFHAGMRASLEASGLTMTTWELSESEKRMTARMDGGNDKVKLRGVAVAVVGKDGLLRGWSAQCIHTAAGAKKAAAACDRVLASFAVTFPDAQLRALEKKKQ